MVRTTGGRVIYDHSGALPLAPASTQKLLVAAAALDLLGASYRFTTTVVAARPPVFGTVGDLWLVGGGDPVLSSPEFTAVLAQAPSIGGQPVTTPIAALADQLLAVGIRRMTGGIHGDDSRYDRTRFLAAWSPAEIKGANVAPLGALEVDDGLDQWRPPRLTADPAGHAAGVLAQLAAARGVVAAQGADGSAPAAGSSSPPSRRRPSATSSRRCCVTATTRRRRCWCAARSTRPGRRDDGRRPRRGGAEAAALGLPTAGLR